MEVGDNEKKPLTFEGWAGVWGVTAAGCFIGAFTLGHRMESFDWSSFFVSMWTFLGVFSVVNVVKYLFRSSP